MSTYNLLKDMVKAIEKLQEEVKALQEYDDNENNVRVSQEINVDSLETGVSNVFTSTDNLSNPFNE